MHRQIEPSEEMPKKDSPPIAERNRFPQLNQICVCGRGCACGESPGRYNEHGALGADTARQLHDLDGRESDASSLSGDEGVEDHLIEVGDFGMVSMREIHAALARNERCLCRPPTEEYPVAPVTLPAGSGADSPNSMDVGMSSGEHSTLSSMILPPRNASPNTLVMQVGSAFSQDSIFQPTPASHFIAPPLWLNYQRAFCFNLDIGMNAGMSAGMRYPTDLSIDETTESDRSSHDFW